MGVFALGESSLQQMSIAAPQFYPILSSKAKFGGACGV